MRYIIFFKTAYYSYNKYKSKQENVKYTICKMNRLVNFFLKLHFMYIGAFSTYQKWKLCRDTPLHSRSHSGRCGKPVTRNKPTVKV